MSIRNFIKSRQLSLLAPAIFIFILFQNCSQVTFLGPNTDGLFTSKNGGGYGGMQKGDYYRFTPNFECENKESFVAGINISDAGVSLVENKKLRCGAVKKSLDPNLIDFSIYQKEVIGYQDGIFEGESNAPTKIPANLVEVWCRDNNDHTGIETLTHFDRTTNLALNRIYYSTPDTDGSFSNQVIADFSVARVVTSKTVHIKDEKGFELTVHRDQPAAQLGLFKGQMSAIVGGKTVARDTFCRLGGSLDAKVWPVTQIVDLNVLFMKTSADKNYFSFSSDTGTPTIGAAHLYSSMIDGSKQVDVSPSLSWANGNFMLSSDSKKLIYMNDNLSNPAAGPLSVVNLDGSSNILLTNNSTNCSDYRISSDSQFLIYNSGDIITPGLTSIPINGGAAINLNPPLTEKMKTVLQGVQTHYTDAFEVSPVGDKVAFLCCNADQNLYTAHVDGSGLTKIPVQLPSGYVLYGMKFPSPTSDQIIHAGAWTDGLIGPIHYIDLAIKLDGSGVTSIPNGWTWDQTSPSSNYITLVSGTDKSQGLLMNLASGTSFQIPMAFENGLYRKSGNQLYSSFFFTQDSSAYVFSTNDPNHNGSYKIVSMATADGKISDLCSGVTASSVTEVSSGVFAIIANDVSSHILNVYVATAQQTCHLVNSIVTDSASVIGVSVKVSPDQQKLLIRRQAQKTDGTFEDMLLYVPLNGRPSFLVNTPVFDAASIDSFDFLNNSQSVIYRGAQIRPGDSNVFLWTAPPL